MSNFPINDKSQTFSYTLNRMVKLSPSMRSLVNALNKFGHVDPIRDCGRNAGTSTIVALMDRGLLRESRHSHGVHQVATTPEQVWDAAYEEYDEREAAELEADGGWGQPEGLLAPVEVNVEQAETVATMPGFTRSLPCLAMPGHVRGGSHQHDHLTATGPECNPAWPTADATPESRIVPLAPPAPDSDPISLALAELAKLRAILSRSAPSVHQSGLLARIDHISRLLTAGA